MPLPLTIGTGRALLGHAALFSPTSLSGLQLWLKADAITGLNDGDAISTWADSSANANNATGTTTTRPLYKTGIINGLPVVRFDGTDDFLTLTSSIAFTAFHIFAVIRSSGASTRAILGGPTGSVEYRTNVLKQELLKTNNASLGQSSSNITTPAVVSASYSSPNSAYYLNGAADGTGSSVQTFTANSSFVGKQATGEAFANDIAELLVYNAVQSTADRLSVERYLGAKWGIAVS